MKMETRKVNLDRKKISSEEIQQKQDWNNVLGEARKLQPPLSKKVWYYGPATLASIGVLASVTLFANSGAKEIEETPKVSQVEELKNIVEIAETEPIKINEESIQKEVELKKEIESEKKILFKKIESTETKSEIVSDNSIEKNSNVEIVELIPAKKEETYIEPKYVFASINSRIGGRISVKEIEKNPLLELNSRSSEVQSFDITYYNGLDDVTRKIEGAEIPTSVIDEMKVNGINSTVYITKIACHSDDKGKFLVPSFNFKLIGK